MATVTATDSTLEPTIPLHRITVDRYQKMLDAGVFGEDEPIFLWRGRLVEKMTKGDDHSIACIELTTMLVKLIPEGWHVRAEQPMRLDDESLPEPDLAIGRGRSRDYRQNGIPANEVSLIVEVSNASLRFDSTEKLQSYAAQNIPTYWIVNLPERRVEVYREPDPSATPAVYRERRILGLNDVVPVLLDGREVGRIAVREILP